MITVSVPEEISKYHEKLFFGLSWRQLLWGAVALVIAIPSYLLLIKHIQIDILSMILFLEVAPCILIGFIHPKGLNFEVYVKYIALHYLTSNRFPIRVAQQEVNHAFQKNRKDCPSAESVYRYSPTKRERKEKRRIIQKNLRTVQLQTQNQKRTKPAEV